MTEKSQNKQNTGKKSQKKESLVSPSNREDGINSLLNSNQNLIKKNLVSLGDQINENIALENLVLKDANLANNQYKQIIIADDKKSTGKKLKKEECSSPYKQISQNQFHDKQPKQLLDLSTTYAIKIECSPKDAIPVDVLTLST